MKIKSKFLSIVTAGVLTLGLIGGMFINSSRVFAVPAPVCSLNNSGIIVTLNSPGPVPPGQTFFLNWNIGWPQTYEPGGEGEVNWEVILFKNGGGLLSDTSGYTTSSGGTSPPNGGSYQVVGGITQSTTYSVIAKMQTAITQCDWTDTETTTVDLQANCTINSFTCDSSIDQLSWSTSNCSSVSIDQGVGAVPANGNAQQVAGGKTYTLSASAGGVLGHT